MLLHGGRSEDSIRSFFAEVYELYVKVRLILSYYFTKEMETHLTFLYS